MVKAIALILFLAWLYGFSWAIDKGGMPFVLGFLAASVFWNLGFWLLRDQWFQNGSISGNDNSPP